MASELTPDQVSRVRAYYQDWWTYNWRKGQYIDRVNYRLQAKHNVTNAEIYCYAGETISLEVQNTIKKNS